MDKESGDLLKITELALFNGISKMKEGNVLDDISGAVEDTALGTAQNIPNELKNTDGTGKKYGIVRQYGGHGVGRIVVVSTGDDWCVSTVDNKASAHFEHTVAVTDDEPLILTALE